MAIKLGINGFGRIGRQISRIAAKHPNIDLVAFNSLADARTNVHLFKYDSTYGRFDGTAELIGDEFVINGSKVKMLCERDPALVPWGDMGVDYVIESTGVFRKPEACAKHIESGAKHVLLSAPAKGEMPTYILGVNHQNWLADGKPAVFSNASCTTNCLAPIAKVLNDNWKIKRAFVNTVHAYTNDQKIIDQTHKDLRRARSAAVNIIPTTTGAAKALGLIIPELTGKVEGLALRVPVITGSIVDFTAELEAETTIEEINLKMIEAANGDMSGILGTTDDPIVSTDIVGDPRSSIVDLALTKVLHGSLIQVVSWYDNEWGYSNRCIDFLEYIEQVA